MSLTLIPGQSYRRQNGEIVVAAKRTNGMHFVDFPFAVQGSIAEHDLTTHGTGHLAFAMDGRALSGQTEHDLVTLVDAAPAPLSLVSGQAYRSRAGNKVTVTVRQSPHLKDYLFEGDTGDTYTANGLYILGAQNPQDLIAPWEPTQAVKPWTLEVGKHYMTREGKIAFVARKLFDAFLTHHTTPEGKKLSQSTDPNGFNPGPTERSCLFPAIEDWGSEYHAGNLIDPSAEPAQPAAPRTEFALDGKRFEIGKLYLAFAKPGSAMPGYAWVYEAVRLYAGLGFARRYIRVPGGNWAASKGLNNSYYGLNTKPDEEITVKVVDKTVYAVWSDGGMNMDDDWCFETDEPEAHYGDGDRKFRQVSPMPLKAIIVTPVY